MNNAMTVRELILQLLQINIVHLSDPVVITGFRVIEENSGYRITARVEAPIIGVSLESDEAGNAIVHIKADFNI